jgi:hypothetical protein
MLSGRQELVTRCAKRKPKKFPTTFSVSFAAEMKTPTFGPEINCSMTRQEGKNSGETHNSNSTSTGLWIRSYVATREGGNWRKPAFPTHIMESPTTEQNHSTNPSTT